MDYDELVKKSKEELDKVKLVEEIIAKRKENSSEVPPIFEKNKFETTIQIERRKLWLSPLITIILTIGSGLISLGIAHILKNQELQSAQISDATKAILMYTVQLDTADNYKQRLFLSKIIALYPNYGDASLVELQRPSVSLYKGLDSIKALTNKVNISAPPSDTAHITASAKANLNNSDKEEIELQNANINGATKDSIKKIEKNISKNKAISNSVLSDSIKQAITFITDINSKVVDQFQALGSVSKNSVERDYGTTWFKVGYFLQFDNMRILLQYLDKKLGIQVQICNLTGSEVCNNPLYNKQWISYDSPFIASVGNSKYQISLQTIDHAGSNPFKLAAYINVVKLSN